MTNGQSQSSVVTGQWILMHSLRAPWVLVIGHSLVIGHWPLVISHYDHRLTRYALGALARYHPPIRALLAGHGCDTHHHLERRQHAADSSAEFRGGNRRTIRALPEI